MLRDRVAGLCLFALLATGPAIGTEARIDDARLVPYGIRIHTVARRLVADIRPQLDARSREILDDISIEAPATWETNAEARRTFTQRRIVQFNAGLLAVSDWLALAMIADWAGHEGCFREYSGYLAELVGHNSRRAWKGRDRKHLQDFSAYAAGSHGQCEKALEGTLDAARREELRDEMLDAVIATVLLHEIAHHVLDHVGGFEQNVLQHRVLEMDADRWAIRTGVGANYELRTAVPLFLFLASTGGGTLEDEIRSGHPAGMKRMRDLLVQTRALLDSRDPVNAHLLDTSIEDLNRSLR